MLLQSQGIVSEIKYVAAVTHLTWPPFRPDIWAWPWRLATQQCALTMHGDPSPATRACAHGIVRSALKGLHGRWLKKTPQPGPRAGGRQLRKRRSPPARKRARTVDFFQPVDHKKGEKLSVDFIDIFAAPPAIAIAGGAAV